MFDLGLIRWLVGRVLQLPPRQTRQVLVQKNLSIAMHDGVVLLADRHSAKEQSFGPVILLRSCYGRGVLFGFMAALFAERGFQVVVQSVRGTTGSGGEFVPMRQEQADGADTLAWVRAQPWFAGKLFTFGPSYLGNVQWAMAHEAPELMDGLALLMTLSNFRDELRGSGGFSLAGPLGWTHLMQDMVNFLPGRRMRHPKPDAIDHALNHLPLGTIDQAAIGKTVSWWQDWTSHDDPEDPWWQAIDHSAAVATLAAPTTMVGGWQDIFLPFQIKDFAARQAAGQEAWLTIGPWTHSSFGGMAAGFREACELFAALSSGRAPYANRARVRLYVQGGGGWRDYAAWPPPEGRPLRLHLRAGGALDRAPPEGDEGATGYTYDPADPTPDLHGPKAMGMSKQRDMTVLAQRSDAIVFTTSSLDRDVDAIGPVTVKLSVRSDRDHTDFFVCLCDVDQKKQSLRVVDGYLRLTPHRPEPDNSGVRSITIECWPTAYRFSQGHKIQLIVTSGAHPRYTRNLGTGEPLATATNMVTANQEILHGATYASSVDLWEVPR